MILLFPVGMAREKINLFVNRVDYFRPNGDRHGDHVWRSKYWVWRRESRLLHPEHHSGRNDESEQLNGSNQ